MQLAGLPAEVLDNIAFLYACPKFLGPPLSLLPLLLTCRSINGKLSMNNSHIYAKIFKHKFSAQAVARRAFAPTSYDYYHQLKHYTTVLRALKAGRLDDSDEPDIDSLLATLTLMLLDDDGLNYAQLNHVNAYDWVMSFIRSRLYEGSSSNKGWPLDNHRNSCVLWACWLLTTNDHLTAESEQQQDDFVDLIFPFVHVHFKYPTAYAPHNHFNLPLTVHSTDVSLAAPTHPNPHGPFPVYNTNTPTMIPYFAKHIPFIPPLIATAARLLYFARRERWSVAIPPNTPRDRTEALARAAANTDGDPEDGSRGPTAEDIEEWNGVGKWVHPNRKGCTILPPSLKDSTLHDPLFTRMRSCLDAWEDCYEPIQEDNGVPFALRLRPGPVYKPGSLTGLWAGRMTVPNQHMLNSLIFDTDSMPPTFSEASLYPMMTVPVYMRLQEHGVFWPAKPAPVGGVAHTYARAGLTHSQMSHTQQFQTEFDQGFLNAWLPNDIQLRKVVEYGAVQTPLDAGEDPSGSPLGHEGEYIELSLPGDQEKYIYQTLRGTPMHDASPEPEPLPSPSSRSRLPDPGRFHDKETCPGCRLREEAARRSRASETDDEDDEEDEDEEIWSTLGFSPCPGVHSVIITGSTDSRHSAAWSRYTYVGRVRPWDGMIAILRKPNTGRRDVDEHSGKLVFYGYLEGGRNFVGGWRMVGGPRVGEVGWEGAFSLGRRE